MIFPMVFIIFKTLNIIFNGLKMTNFVREPLNTSLENNIMQHIYRSYEFFDDFFKFAFGIFLGYFENILGINNDHGRTSSSF